MRTRTVTLWSVVWLCLCLLAVPADRSHAQAGFNDDRVMLQGFYWESYRHGQPNFPQFGSKRWYDIVRDKAADIRQGGFNLVWLPPPSYAGTLSAGYNPKEYFNLSNSYGTLQQHRSMVESLLKSGVEPVADLVLNHRDGSKAWADFKNPDWGPWAITRYDEAFTNPNSEVYNTPVDQRGADEGRPSYLGGGTTYAYPDFRDIDHSNGQVRRDLVRYLFQLQSLGYRGWRYDMVHGYDAKWIAVYNRATHPTFSVGEYDWGAHAQQRGWIWNTATVPGDLQTSSSVFDFSTYFTLKDNKGNYTALYGYGNGIGMVGDTTDGLPWKNRAVTFLENHDTGYRTNEDGTPQANNKFDSFANNWEVEQAYAYILTHPGLPTVYWKHYFDWGQDLREKI
ncbi:MAG TPA: alpha-amylase family glycosyl hydrolase [Geomonas sp.]|nr:alpha-amylase family glycosyl hydrolase [Geomonas sp.]